MTQPERVAEVEDFVDFLHGHDEAQQLTCPASQLSEVAFATTSVSRSSIAIAIVDPSIALDTRFGRSGCLGCVGTEGAGGSFTAFADPALSCSVGCCA